MRVIRVVLDHVRTLTITASLIFYVSPALCNASRIGVRKVAKPCDT